MAQTRTQVAKDLGSMSHQTALVKKMMKQTVSPVRFTIPGGKSMIDDLDYKRLNSAIYTWLRRCKFFTEVTLSFASDTSKMRTRTHKVQDFTVSPAGPEWETTKEKRRWLAEQMGRIIQENPVVTITAKPDGIYITQDLDEVFGPSHALWEPYVEFMPRRTEQWKEQN